MCCIILFFHFFGTDGLMCVDMCRCVAIFDFPEGYNLC